MSLSPEAATALARQAKALPSIEKARAMLSACITHGEVKKIRVIAQAVASLERGKLLAVEAGKIVVECDTRRAELEREEKAQRPRGAAAHSKVTSTKPLPNKQKVAESRRAPLLDLSEADKGAYFAACEKTLEVPSPATAATLAKLPEPARKKVLAALGEDPDVRKAIRAARREQRLAKLAEIAKGNEPLASGETAERYPIIYADPPWRYEHNEDDSRAIENHYPTMELDDIRALDVASSCTPDAVLFLWATSPKLAEALSVIEAWGFTYRTCAVWTKDKIGMGYYFRQQHELLLVAVRGNPPKPAPADRPSSIVSAPRSAQHSAKPVEVYGIIERMYPTLPKRELFSRTPRPGWAAWGNQAGGRAA